MTTMMGIPNMAIIEMLVMVMMMTTTSSVLLYWCRHVWYDYQEQHCYGPWLSVAVALAVAVVLLSLASAVFFVGRGGIIIIIIIIIITFITFIIILILYNPPTAEQSIPEKQWHWSDNKHHRVGKGTWHDCVSKKRMLRLEARGQPPALSQTNSESPM